VSRGRTREFNLLASGAPVSLRCSSPLVHVVFATQLCARLCQITLFLRRLYLPPGEGAVGLSFNEVHDILRVFGKNKQSRPLHAGTH
jgi:hypothetical protein